MHPLGMQNVMGILTTLLDDKTTRHEQQKWRRLEASCAGEVHLLPEDIQQFVAILAAVGSRPARVLLLLPGQSSLRGQHSHSLILLSTSALRQSNTQPIVSRHGVSEHVVGQQHCREEM